MDIFWIVVGGIFIAAGILGCFLPILPGPPMAFIGLWIQQLKTQQPFSSKFLWIWAGIVLFVTAMDYWLPMYSTKKLGGSKHGIWGCTIGLFLGFWMGPFGIILGPFLGAFVGEVMANKNSVHAFLAAMGSFLGFLFSTLLKLVACLVIVWYWMQSW